jgi:hypothetical protein
MFTELKDKLIRKLATSFLLKWADGKKVEITRAVQAINMIIAALYLLAPTVDGYLGSHLSQHLDFINDKWLLALSALSHFGLEFGLQDKAAKARLAGK